MMKWKRALGVALLLAGMAVLAVYMEVRQEGETLADFLDERVFRHPKSVTLTPNVWKEELMFAAFSSLISKSKESISSFSSTTEYQKELLPLL